MRDTPVDKRDEAIEAFLKMNWDRINGTCLSYTALPDSDVTALLCDLANALPKQGSRGVVSYLMPTVSTESIRTPQYPDLGPVQDVKPDEWSADSMDDIHFLLKTHVLGREGKYLIPIQLLIEDEIDSTLNNVYFNVGTHHFSMTTLNSEEWTRLYQHGPLTKALHEAIGQRELLNKEKHHLLGHLTALINQLQFNSASGVGQERTAGEGVYNAIVQFQRYYEVLEASEKNRMPAALIQALDTLFLLASDPAANTKATGKLSIDTCIATRRTDILNALHGHEVLLADIGLTGTQKSELIAENQRQIKVLKNELKTLITEKKYSNGQDSLGITRTLLQTFICPINLKTHEDVADLVCHLSPNEITALCCDDLLCETIVTAIKSLENLIMLYMQLSPERLNALNLAISEILAKNIIRSGNELSMMLGLFDAEKRRLIIESFMPFKTANGLHYLRGLFSNSRSGVFEMMRESLPGIIQTAGDFSEVLVHLSHEQRTVLCKAMEARLPGMIQNSTEFSRLLKDCSSEQRTGLCKSMEARLNNTIPSGQIITSKTGCVSFSDALRREIETALKRVQSRETCEKDFSEKYNWNRLYTQGCRIKI